MAENPQLMYVAGRMVAEGEATVSALDAGLLLGAGLFETLRTYGGRPFRLARHMARLRSSGQFFRIFVRESDDEIAAIIARLLEANGLADARLRITATRGPVTEGLSDDEAPRATLLVTAGGQVSYPPELYERGATAVISDIRINESDPIVFHKTTNYLGNLLAIRDAHSGGATEALRFNTRNRLAEGAISNIFLVSGGRLATPPDRSGHARRRRSAAHQLDYGSHAGREDRAARGRPQGRPRPPRPPRPHRPPPGRGVQGPGGPRNRGPSLTFRGSA
jgi:branched-subunit amino acid aminotransferase/4-amino-4-deoxychorismate lyase